ncbi:hypothetical protein BQ8794_140051 [Mesorhizobium prunaredense]|uniref:Uncharacterized protein n=1 Tax=Mesorhizobium prunaredense TaxID=1631249 RepID=A0A1R3V584_9HYPH|nr:hypothetical protein BQ8794_140051 [Mesorhizobium prunaredense]
MHATGLPLAGTQRGVLVKPMKNGQVGGLNELRASNACGELRALFDPNCYLLPRSQPSARLSVDCQLP